MNKNLKTLVIVESPHKAKVISKILKDAGFSSAKVIASVGHILKLEDGNAKAFNSGIFPEANFKMNLKVASDKHKIVDEIKQHSAWADQIFIASDNDRSGEFISWSILEYAKIPKAKAARMVMHEITPKAVLKAIENPVAFNNDLVDAEKARQCTDKLIGYGLSPLGKKHIGAKSIGRAQSVGLMLVADREDEILNFIPEQYFNLYLNFSKENKQYKAKYFGYKNEKYDKITNATEIKTIKYHCDQSNFIIEDIKKTTRQESPKAPFCTATFQQEASAKLGLKVKDLMSIAQKLYEAGKITYMRTDDTTMSPEFLEDLKLYVENTFGKNKYKGLRAQKQTGNLVQAGHECLRVCDPELTPEIFAAEESNNFLVRVYSLIWQRTIASVLPNAVYAEIAYIINNSDHKFTFIEKHLTEPGFKSVYSADLEQVEQKTSCPFSIGEILENTELKEEQKETTPPPRYSEATLVKELQRIGVGRPSTYATIVETVLSPTRGYAILDEKQIKPTDRGLQLAAYCKRAFPNLINLNYTKEMEDLLDEIASGKLDWVSYMQTFYQTLTDTINANQETGLATEVPEKLCPKCESPMVVRRSRFGKLFYGCSKYPKCTGIIGID